MQLFDDTFSARRSRRRNRTILIRASEAERQALRDIAAERGLTISDYLRALVVADTRDDERRDEEDADRASESAA